MTTKQKLKDLEKLAAENGVSVKQLLEAKRNKLLARFEAISTRKPVKTKS